MSMRTRSIIGLISAAWIAIILGGCSVNPTYTVRVINDSSTNLNARITHDRKFDSDVILESMIVKAGEERTLGPVESPPLERVILTIAATGSSISAPEQKVIKRGSYTARVTRGGSTSWAPYEVSLTKD